MSFLRSILGRKPSPPPADPGVVKAALDDLSAFRGDVMRHFGEAAFEQDSMVRQVLSVYAFGGLHVLCQQKGLSLPEAHALCLAMLTKSFGYPAEDSVAKAQALMTAAGDRTSHLYGIIHRGIDGFLSWQSHPSDFDASDFKALIVRLSPKPAA